MSTKTFVSLGNSCSIAYNLKLCNLRTEAYPFDWVRVTNINNVTTLIDNKFNDFLDIDTFKRSDSTFALATDNELIQAVNRVQDMLSKDILDNWYEERNNLYKKIGMTTNVCVTKTI